MTAGAPSSRRRVAREAANLLYFGIEKEYKQAKLKAAKTFGLHFIPTNLEVAMEIDKIAEENEGIARQERLVRMRREALKIMRILEKYDSVLVGSVWRGTIHHDSDLDIIVHHDEPRDILKALEHTDLRIQRSEWVNVTKKGKKKATFHIHAVSPIKENVEIIVHSPDEACLVDRCEIYGDEIRGLRLSDLEKLLEEDPTERFVPSM